MVLKGRLGLETARVPQADRHGLLWLKRGRLAVEDGNLVFTTAGTEELESGRYDIPFQKISNILLGPGGVVSHDALRLLARQQTGLLAIGANGVRLYAVSMPSGPDRNERARRQARLWADQETRTEITRRMYAMRMGGDLPAHARDLDSLRGMEGQRMKRVYENLADQYDVEWSGRRYDRNDPESDDPINKAINHAATAIYASARIAVAVTGAIPQLGFIHESSGHAFALDIADLHRASTTLPIAFAAVKQFERSGQPLERITRYHAGETLRKRSIIPEMIDQIKDLLDPDGSEGE
jgi:CRISPR-associated protein Cas1